RGRAMNRATELVHDAVTLLQRHGFVPTVSNGGKHVRVRWVDQGRRFTLYIRQSRRSARPAQFAGDVAAKPQKWGARMRPTVQMIEYLESKVADVYRQVEGIHAVVTNWDGVPAEVNDPICRMAIAVQDLSFALSIWLHVREREAAATVVKIADYI